VRERGNPANHAVCGLQMGERRALAKILLSRPVMNAIKATIRAAGFFDCLVPEYS